MRELPKDKIRLQHILEAIERINSFVDGFTEDTLNDDVRTKHAIAYNIQIIGEAVYKLTTEFKETHSETPWAMIEKMRHILVHDYYRVNIHIMWLVITEDLPSLKPNIDSYFKEL